MKLRVYLDTSVLSVAVDERTPERRALTEDFLARAREIHQVSTSEVARQEIERTREPEKREAMLRILEQIEVFEVTEEMSKLARDYVNEGIFGEKQDEDAQHVSAAVCSRQDILVSWNFRHLVNRQRRAKVLAFNAALGYPSIEILSPPEI